MLAAELFFDRLAAAAVDDDRHDPFSFLWLN